MVMDVVPMRSVSLENETRSPICTGCLNTNSFTATVATRPRAMRPAAVPPAMSTCDMIQPPKMSPFWFASAGIGMTRSAGCLLGSFSMREILQRPAAEWREALLDQLRTVRVRPLLHRAALFPAVDALPGFLAELACVHLALQDARHLDIAGGFRERLACMQADVQSDGIGELRRSHWHAELFHRRVECLRLHALVDQPECILHVGAQDPVHQEARRILHWQRQLVDVPYECRRVLRNLRARLRTMHHLYHLQERHRVEEVDADQPRR